MNTALTNSKHYRTLHFVKHYRLEDSHSPPPDVTKLILSSV